MSAATRLPLRVLLAQGEASDEPWLPAGVPAAALEAVPRLALINSLATYRIDHWRKWCEARIPAALVRAIDVSERAFGDARSTTA